MDTDSALTVYVAAELRALRGRRKITFDDLAERSGVAKASLLRYLNGHRAIPMDVLDAAAEVLGSTAWQIIFDAENARRAIAEGPATNVTPIRQSVPTEDEAKALGAVAKRDVSEVDEFENPDDDA